MEVKYHLKDGGSFWTMINPYWKNGEVKLINQPTKKWWPRIFQETASYCIPSFTLELKIQTDLFFCGWNVVFWYSTTSIQQEGFFSDTWNRCWWFFCYPKHQHVLIVLCLFVGATYPSPAPSIPVSFGIPVILGGSQPNQRNVSDPEGHALRPLVPVTLMESEKKGYRR